MNNPLSAQTNYSILKELLPGLYVVLGFVLGLIGTIFTEYLRKRRRRIEFREGMRAELKQALAMLAAHAFQLDSKVTVVKLQDNFALLREFDLFREGGPLMGGSWSEIFNKTNLTSENLKAYADCLNQKAKINDLYKAVKKIHCNFIQDNISSISLLTKSERSLLLNILRRLNIINDQISRLDFPFEKSYDSNVSNENRDRLRLHFKNSCQFISDWSYIAAKEIASLLRQ